MCATPLGSWKKKDWKFGSFSNACSSCGREPEAGDLYYSVLADPEEVRDADFEEDENVGPDAEESSSSDLNEANGEQESSREEESKKEEESGSNGLFRRLDFCESCWDDPEFEIYSYWSTRIPEPEEDDKLTPDRSTLGSIWKGLREQASREKSNGDGEENSMNLKVQYLVTLMLMRKGYLALEDKYRKDGGQIFKVRVRGTEDDIHEIPEPPIREQEIEEITRELESVLQLEEESS